MLAQCGKVLVVVTLVLMTGLHWAALQTVAWTTMFAANLGSESFSAAVSDTFDGQHPCPLCKAISAGKRSEKKSAAVSVGPKLEFLPVVQKIALIPPPAVSAFASAQLSAGASFPKPPVPPPRCFQV